MASGLVTFDDLVRFHREVIVPDLDARFERLEDRMAGRFGRLEAQVDARFDAVDARFDAVDRRFDDIDRRFGLVAGHLFALHERIDSVETRLQSHHEFVIENFDEVFHRLDALSVEYVSLKAGMERVEHRLGVLEQNR